MKSHNFYHAVFSVLITFGILGTIFIIIVGASAWLSLVILLVIALFGLCIGAFMCDVYYRMQKGREADL